MSNKLQLRVHMVVNHFLVAVGKEALYWEQLLLAHQQMISSQRQSR